MALSLLNSTPQETKRHIAVIDSTGEEFWYSPEFEVLSPGFAFKRWTKKQIIDLFNESSNSKEMQMTYSEKSLSSKNLSKIIFDVCKLINSHNNRLHRTALRAAAEPKRSASLKSLAEIQRTAGFFNGLTFYGMGVDHGCFEIAMA